MAGEPTAATTLPIQPGRLSHGLTAAAVLLGLFFGTIPGPVTILGEPDRPKLVSSLLFPLVLCCCCTALLPESVSRLFALQGGVYDLLVFLPWPPLCWTAATVWAVRAIRRRRQLWACGTGWQRPGWRWLITPVAFLALLLALLTSLPLRVSFWAHRTALEQLLSRQEVHGEYAGFVFDPSRSFGGIDVRYRSVWEGSNVGDQTFLYLGDGWYAFENYLD